MRMEFAFILTYSCSFLSRVASKLNLPYIAVIYFYIFIDDLNSKNSKGVLILPA